MLSIFTNKMGNQISRLFTKVIKTKGANDPLNKFNGIITRAAADASVPKITPAGVITAENVVTILETFGAAIPDKFIEDPNFIIHMNMTDYRLLQTVNNGLSKDYNGVLGRGMLSAYLGTKIVGLVSMPKDHVLGAVSTTDRGNTNLFMGVDQRMREDRKTKN